MGLFNLSNLKINQPAEISHYEYDEMPAKLMEMGFLPGSKIIKINEAPFDGPIMIYLDTKNSRLAIRKEEARHIYVKLRELFCENKAVK